MAASVKVQDFGCLPPTALLNLLASHLPHSLPVLRRLQCRARPGGPASPEPHVFLAHDASYDLAQYWPDKPPRRFAAAFLSLESRPENAMWLYSTLEDADADADCSAEESLACAEQALAIFRLVQPLRAGSAWRDRGFFMVGPLHERLRQALLARGVCMTKTRNVGSGVDWQFCGKWLLRVEDLPAERRLGELARDQGPEDKALRGARWDVVRKEDMELVLARTRISRSEDTLLTLPSLAVRLADGTIIAWAFLGLDGSLITLHCEESYRGRGIAKLLASNLLRERLSEYGDDGWGAADVIIGNIQSEGVCKSIGGRRAWTVSWAMIDLSSLGDAA